jgi:hypothetical protein
VHYHEHVSYTRCRASEWSWGKSTWSIGFESKNSNEYPHRLKNMCIKCMITSPWCVIRLPWLVEPKFITICQIYVHVQTRRLADEALSKPVSHMFIIIRILSRTCCNFSLDVNWQATFFCMAHDVHKFCFFSRQLMCNFLFFVCMHVKWHMLYKN